MMIKILIITLNIYKHNTTQHDTYTIGFKYKLI